ncbi:hypothetical protein VN97_g13210, partial [Penicillium thymicola]
LVVDM